MRQILFSKSHFPVLLFCCLISTPCFSQNEQQTTSNKQQTTSNKQQTTNNKQQTTNNEQQATSNKQQTTNNKQQATNNKQQTTNNKQQTTNNEQQATSNKQQTTNNKQQTTNNEQQATNNKQQTTSNKQQTTNNEQQAINNKQQTTNNEQQATPKPETHLKNIRQLTFGGDNAEAYWSPDGKWLTFQSNYTGWGLECDQIFTMEVGKAAGDSTYKPTLISTGKGRTTCSYFMPDGKHILFASTHTGGHACPHTPNLREGGKYLWPIFDTYDIFVADMQGNIVKQLTNTPGYDAEAVVSPKGDKILFTSDRSGDLELWTMDMDGSNQKQITFDLGYDGGAFFSPDGSKIVFRASRPKTAEAIAEYRDLLKKGLVAPADMEIFTCNVDGSNLRQVTHLGKANWAPFFHPSGKKIIFSSNHHSSRGYDFQLYMINEDGTGLEQITHESIFNSFPMFSPDGKKLVFSSNRDNGGTRDTNVFVADWVD